MVSLYDLSDGILVVQLDFPHEVQTIISSCALMYRFLASLSLLWGSWTLQLLGFVKSSVRFMDLHAWWLQSIHASHHQFQHLVHLSRQSFNFFYGKCRFNYCRVWFCATITVTTARLVLRNNKSVAVFNFWGKSVGDHSRSVFTWGTVELIKTCDLCQHDRRYSLLSTTPV